jgi:hypothetical protein
MFSDQSHGICRGQGQGEEGCVPLTGKIHSQLEGPLGPLRIEEALRAYGTVHEYPTLNTLRHKPVKIFSLLHSLSYCFSTSTTHSTNLMFGWVEYEVSKIRQTTLVQSDTTRVYLIT